MPDKEALTKWGKDEEAKRDKEREAEAKVELKAGAKRTAGDP